MGKVYPVVLFLFSCHYTKISDDLGAHHQDGRLDDGYHYAICCLTL